MVCRASGIFLIGWRDGLLMGLAEASRTATYVKHARRLAPPSQPTFTASVRTGVKQKK